MQKPNRKAPVPISLTDVSSFVFCSFEGGVASFFKIVFWEPFVSVSSSDISDVTKAVLSLILPQTLIALNKRLIWDLRLTKYLRVDIFKMSQIEDIHGVQPQRTFFYLYFHDLWTSWITLRFHIAKLGNLR